MVGVEGGCGAEDNEKDLGNLTFIPNLEGHVASHKGHLVDCAAIWDQDFGLEIQVTVVENRAEIK